MAQDRRSLPVLTRCTGHCCREVRIHVSPAVLQAAPRRWADGRQIAGILRFDRYDDTDPSLNPWVYSCSQWDERTGDCGIYERRPAMCREYPYGDQCVFAGCTDPSARMPPEVRHAS